MDSLSSQMEHLLKMQQTVLSQLDSLSRDVRSMGQDLARMREEDREAEVCREIRGAVQKAGERVDSHSRRLDGVEKLMEGTQQVISFIGEVVKSSRLVDLLFKQAGNKSHKKVRFENVLEFLLLCRLYHLCTCGASLSSQAASSRVIELLGYY